MAPDRGNDNTYDDASDIESDTAEDITDRRIGQEPTAAYLAKRSEQPQFTLRAVIVGLFIGVLITFSNTYFGLQTGWISGMAMPSALIGFAYFQGLRTLMGRFGEGCARFGFGEGFTEVENVLVQTVAGSVGMMPLGAGFVGVIPALEFLLKPSETPEIYSQDLGNISTLALADDTAGIRLPLGKLIMWAMGLCFFGVVFAVPLRKEVIVREKLRFPSGTATALMIGVLHGGEKTGQEGEIEEQWARDRRLERRRSGEADESRALIGDRADSGRGHLGHLDAGESAEGNDSKRDWLKQIRLLLYSFLVSGIYTLVSYFIPQLHSIPILGTYLSDVWQWNLNPSPAYVGQGIIMGPATTIHMFFGAILGWAILSPLAKFQGWASGDVGDWEKGSKGWIVWVSLAIMLADAIVNLGWLVLKPIIWYSRELGPDAISVIREKGFSRAFKGWIHSASQRSDNALAATKSKATSVSFDGEEEYDAPEHHQIGVKTTVIGLTLTLAFCIFTVQYSFSGIINIGLTIFALILSLLLSIMGVRALGETDLNPVSGISKLTQLIFAAVTPAGSKNAVVINLLAGGISEAGALQAGDLLQDLKCGHLLGASPKAQFYGQIIGSAVGAIVSAAVYKLYTNVYTIPSDLFQVPTGYVWVFTARLVTGQGLPDHIGEFAIAAAAIWSVLTAFRIYGQSKRNSDGSKGAPWVAYIPGGIAVAVGMYNTPSFTLARTVGGLIAWIWIRWWRREETTVIVLASGLILGEGIVSIVNLGLASASVPHL